MPSSAKSTRLVIVESPAKVKTISGYLGPGYVLEASLGHVRDLPAGAKQLPEKYKKEPWAVPGRGRGPLLRPGLHRPPGTY